MKTEVIHRLVADKNKRLEEDTLVTAERIIGQIAEHQSDIQTSQEKIAKLREDLKALEVKSLDVKSILGE